jgi:hypothetical protein
LQNSSLTTLSFFITYGFMVFGLWLFLQGRKGSRIDDHPVCGGCKYDLFGQPEGTNICPECGADLHANNLITIGNRRPETKLMLTGGGIILAGVLFLTSEITFQAKGIRLIQYKSFHSLLFDAANNHNVVGNNAWENANEIVRRLQNSELSASEEQQVVAQALSLQADHSEAWYPIWGDIIEFIRSNHQMPEVDWNRYISQGISGSVQVRPYCTRGDPIPYVVNTETRFGTSFSSSGTPQVLISVRIVPGSRYQITPPAGLRISGRALIFPSELVPWQSLAPGPQTLEIQSIPIWNNRLYPPFTCQGSWTLLPDGQSSVRLYRDEALAASIQANLSCHSDFDPNGNPCIEIGNTGMPIKLAFDVLLKTSTTEWKQKGAFIMESYRTVTVYPDVPENIGDRVDVVLRPSISKAAATMDIDSLLDHEFVFKDMNIQKRH